MYKYFRDHTKGFAELTAFQAGQSLFGVRRSGNADNAQSIVGDCVSGNYFPMFGISPYLGRLLTPSDDKSDAPLAAVMSYRFWQQKYGADPSAVGGAFTLDGKPFKVVGIAPPRFFGDTLRDTAPDLFVPLAAEPRKRLCAPS